MAIHAIILSGGHGTRLWPASSPERPKQFLPLLGSHSTFQSTVERMAIATGDRAPIVVAGEAHAAEIGRQLAALGRSEAVLLVEPAARDSAPAIAAAAAWIEREDPDGIGVMVASDHHLPDAAAFAASVAQAAMAAEAGAIVTFGVRPSSPSPAYGYIKLGEPFAPGSPTRRVARFAEKPDAQTAAGYIAEGFLWNSGNFVFRARDLLAELDRFAPGVASAARAAVAEVAGGSGVHRLGSPFAGAPKISIDFAVMEKTDRAAVVPLDTPWSDLGAWDAVHAASLQDADGNAAPAGVHLQDTRGSLVRVSGEQTVALLGVRDLAVIVEGDAVLVAHLGSSQGVKHVADAFRASAAGRSAAAAPPDPAARLRAQAADLALWLRTGALPLWSAMGVDRKADAFRELLDARGRPVRSPRRLRVQGRQTYVYALAGVRGWEGPWEEAVALGLRSLKNAHRLPSGGYATLVGPDGGVQNDAVMLYDQAFVLLAGAWARRAGVWDAAEAEALHLLETVLDRRRNPAGGMRETDEARPWQSNPHMHLLEAALAWAEIGDSPRWAALAAEIAHLALTRFIDPKSGVLREFFAQDWSPAAGDDGRVVEPGHQFEWAWLLERWGGATNHAGARDAARRLYAIGAAYGVDPVRGVAVNALTDDFATADAGARLWPQTERLKAALRLSATAEGDEREGLLADAAAAIDGLRLYFEGLPAGLWRDKMAPDGGFRPEAAPASSLYHIACAIDELEAWAATPAPGSAAARL